MRGQPRARWPDSGDTAGAPPTCKPRPPGTPPWVGRRGLGSPEHGWPEAGHSPQGRPIARRAPWGTHWGQPGARVARELPGADTGSPKPAVPHGQSVPRGGCRPCCLPGTMEARLVPSPWLATLWAGSGVPDTAGLGLHRAEASKWESVGASSGAVATCGSRTGRGRTGPAPSAAPAGKGAWANRQAEALGGVTTSSWTAQSSSRLDHDKGLWQAGQEEEGSTDTQTWSGLACVAYSHQA